jgi:uracil-DNA glycosylase family 4
MDALDALHAEIRAHRGCGFEPCEQAAHLVPGEGSHTAEVVLLGEAPGAKEDELGLPFVGRSGRLLDELLAAAGLDRADVFIANVFKARPPGNRDPTAAEVAHHLPWLERQLELIAPRLVIPLGRHALAHFDRRAKISEVHGRLLGDHRAPALFPWYHPAAGLRSTGVREAMFADARALPAALAEVRSGDPTG